MTYTPKQQEYIDSVGGAAHMSAVEIIGELEKREPPPCPECGETYPPYVCEHCGHKWYKKEENQ